MFTCHAPFSVAALASLVSIPWQSFTNANLECYAYGQMFTGVQTRLGKIWRNILPVLPRYLTCSTIRWRIIYYIIQKIDILVHSLPFMSYLIIFHFEQPLTLSNSMVGVIRILWIVLSLRKFRLHLTPTVDEPRHENEPKSHVDCRSNVWWNVHTFPTKFAIRVNKNIKSQNDYKWWYCDSWISSHSHLEK